MVKFRSLAFVGAIFVVIFAVAACSSAAPTPTPVGPETYNVQVGAEDLTQALEIEAFLPHDLTINAGDTIVFNKKTAEPHTITFNTPPQIPEPFLPQADGRLQANPEIFFASPPVNAPPADPGAPTVLAVSFDGNGFTNSGFLQGPDDTYKVTFSAPGTYQVQCLIHPSMSGTITVNAAGTVRTMTATTVQQNAASQLAKHKTDAQTLKSAISVPAATANADGSQDHKVFAAATDSVNGNDFYAFLGGENLSIKAGDTVTWSMEKNEPGTPHTISFLSGAPIPELIVVEPQPAGPPLLFLNPAVGAPSPEQPGPYEGTGVYSSGMIVAGAPMPQTYTLSFTKPGTYKYLCLLHDSIGMNGTITVAP